VISSISLETRRERLLNLLIALSLQAYLIMCVRKKNAECKSIYKISSISSRNHPCLCALILIRKIAVRQEGLVIIVKKNRVTILFFRVIGRRRNFVWLVISLYLDRSIITNANQVCVCAISYLSIFLVTIIVLQFAKIFVLVFWKRKRV